jgi:ATPase subunit of ABC transporter with duplicated ATPase domains
MSARYIAVTDLAWSTPDGRPVFRDLNLTFGRERTGVVGRNGVGKSTLLRLMTGEHKPHAGAITVGGRLATLRQSVQAAPDETIASLFGVAAGLSVLQRAAAGQATEEDLAAADWTLEERISTSLQAMGLSVEPDARLCALSGGQRTRAGLAALIFAKPDFLILDEPTNNLDRGGRDAVARMLDSWRAGAVVVSHDRELLEGMDAIVELTSLEATRYGGGWSAYESRKAAELAALEHGLAAAERRVASLARAQQTEVERKARRDGAGRRKAAKGDMPKILVGARKARAEATSGEKAKIAGRQITEAQAKAQTLRARVEVLAPLAVEIPSTGLAPAKEVLRLEDVSVGYRADRRLLSGLNLTVSGPERLAITGPNGSGKSTLLATMVGVLPPLSGRVWRGVPFALLDQSVTLLAPGETILENFRRLNPGSGENVCRAALARFRFRAEASLQAAGSLSGGERLRAGLACVLGGAFPPPLLILDEPSNHLDIESLEAVEAGLGAFDGALVVVSHDEAFLEAIGVLRRLELPRPNDRPLRGGA